MLLLAAILTFGGSPIFAATIGNTETFNFTGTCSDCTGQGTATLVLTNYTLGNDITSANFVSFDYSSNLFTMSVTTDNLFSIAGNLPASLPSFAFVQVLRSPDQTMFESSTDGTWFIGAPADRGTNGIWAAAVSGVPEPASSMLFLGGLIGLGLLRKKRTVV